MEFSYFLSTDGKGLSWTISRPHVVSEDPLDVADERLQHHPLAHQVDWNGRPPCTYLDAGIQNFGADQLNGRKVVGWDLGNACGKTNFFQTKYINYLYLLFGR